MLETAKGRLYISYNGEIYNYLEIRKNLKSYGYTFQTNSDTEVLIKAWDKWGEECLKKFDGMWAFAILNLKNYNLYISRDIDPDILNYLNETEKAVTFYYSVENSQTGIKITFAIIYVIVVTLLLFLSTVLAITFATRLTKPIISFCK